MQILKYFPVFESMENFGPAKMHVPKWYKTTPISFGEKMSFENPQFTFKACTPFLESFTLGYIVTLSGDMLWEFDSESEMKYRVTWRQSNVNMMTTRSTKVVGDMPWPNEFEQIAFSWDLNLCLDIPKSHSVLLTHPLNRHDLPFVTMSAVIDGFNLANGSVPFFLKKGFQGLLPAGTPIAQVIPFKRENWKSILDKKVLERASITRGKSSALYRGWYKSNIWKKKHFE